MLQNRQKEQRLFSVKCNFDLQLTPMNIAKIVINEKI